MDVSLSVQAGAGARSVERRRARRPFRYPLAPGPMHGLASRICCWAQGRSAERETPGTKNVSPRPQIFPPRAPVVLSSHPPDRASSFETKDDSEDHAEARAHGVVCASSPAGRRSRRRPPRASVGGTRGSGRGSGAFFRHESRLHERGASRPCTPAAPVSGNLLNISATSRLWSLEQMALPQVELAAGLKPALSQRS
jgi:hypothetical protein